MMKNWIFMIFTLLIFSGCSSDSSDAPATATGVFKDSNVSGLTYISGNQSGVTDANGQFTYETGKTVTFSIGGVTLGTGNGSPVVTPLNLVPAGSTNSSTVLNIARFLMVLDTDGDPDNGITISTAVQTAAETWSQVDFTTADLNTALTSIMADVGTADSRTPVLTAANTARSHLETTLRCSYAGAFSGTYAGGDNGNFAFLVNALTGNVSGFAYSVPDAELFSLLGTSAISLDQNVAFTSGDVSSGATFTGNFTNANTVSGTWNNSIAAVSGTYSGSRIGGAVNAVYRFTGSFTGGGSGLFSFDIDASDQVTGVSYAVEDGTLSTISGSVSGNDLSATVSGGATVTGTLNKSTGSLSGTWSDTSGSGAFSGSGCQLN